MRELEPNRRKLRPTKRVKRKRKGTGQSTSKSRTVSKREAKAEEKLEFFPRRTARDLKAEDLEKTVFSVDLQGSGNRQYYSLSILLSFSPIAIEKIGGKTKKTYYLAATGARASFDTRGGLIEDHTLSENITVNYNKQITNDRTRNFDVTLGKKSGSALGGVRTSTTTGDRSESTWQGTECALAAVKRHNGRVDWTIDPTRGEKVVRDFMEGNVPLSARFRFGESGSDVIIEARPTNVGFFDQHRQRFGPLREAVTLLRLLAPKVKFIGGYRFQSPAPKS